MKWSLGTIQEFWISFLVTMVLAGVFFWGYWFLKKKLGVIGKSKPGIMIFALLLAMSIVVGRWLTKWILD